GGIATECAECAKSPATSNGVAVAEEDVGLWLCLKCGHQACGRSRRQHALKHQQTPRSEPHSLAVNTELWNIWCYICGSEVSAQCRKKLHECVEFIKRQEEAPAVPKNRTENVSEKSPAEAFQKGSSSLKPNSVTSPTNNLPRVRGLCNVGNTCFFNAVLQCLARTPFLLPVLQEMSEPGTKFSLPGDPENEDLVGILYSLLNCMLQPVLEGELGKWGNLTEILASTLIELQSSKCDVYNPSRLLNKLIQRCPQFGGGEQHDSHELLRHLLEGVRTEDLKAVLTDMIGTDNDVSLQRYQSSILQLHGLSGKSNPTQVEEEVRAKAKAYGRQAAEMMLHPEQVFRGFLVSTLECQSCRHTSQRVESFLDLSLPVMADKFTGSSPRFMIMSLLSRVYLMPLINYWLIPELFLFIQPQPPVMRRKSNNEESYDLCGNVSEGQPSKHQMKKERKQARKERKKQKGWRAEGEQPTIAEESAIVKNSAESEQSDADVEDNVEQDAGSKDVGESGYSSEKLGNEDSAVESPISQLANGDSALASPASPADMGEVDRQSLSPVCNGDLMIESPSRDTPSPVSSEVNIDYSVLAQGDCASPDCARPVSRFEFCNDDDMDSGEGAARYSPVEEAKSLPVSDLCEDMSRLTVDYYTNTCTSFVLVSQPNTNGCEEPLVCGGDTERVDQIEEVERVGEAEKLDQVEKTGQVERVEEADEVEQVVEESDVVTDSSCKGDVVTNWSATVSPRYQCDDGECSLQSCLNQFTALELMTGNNKVGCENCTQRQNQGKEGKMVCTNSTKQLLVKTPPAVLILHLKRFQVDRAMFRKMSRHVSFPLVLDLAPICSAMYKATLLICDIYCLSMQDSLMMKPGQNQVQYALYGVVEHSGTLHGGHYVAYVKVRLKTQETVWSKNGYDNLNNLHNAINKHEKSQAHIFSVLQSKSFGSSRIDIQLDSQLRVNVEQHSEMVRKNREILKRLIDTVCFLAIHELPFRGHCESEEAVNKGVYLCALNYLAKYDLTLSHHPETSTTFCGTSNRIQNDLILAVSDVVMDNIKQELSKTSFVAIMLFETSDIMNASQLSTTLRCVDSENGEINERFICFTDVSNDRSASGLFEHVQNIVTEYDISNKLVAQTFDGAAVMAGHTNGLRAKVRSPLKNNDPRWLFLPPDPQSPKRGMEKDEGGIAVGGSAEPPPGKWYFVSDSRVVEVGEERVLRSQAYLLFYERIW
ncbi:hypothetical protein ANN_15902, partial [Periplaneta americana]